MFITITGELGSGKSTIAKLLDQKHGFALYSTGSIQREIAKEKGITTLELNQQMSNDLNNIYDKMIDDKTVELSENNAGKNIVFDSRMAWHFVRKSLKVYVTVDPHVAADRVMKAGRGQEEQYHSLEEATRSLLKRKQLEDSRFADMYHVNTTDFNNYDLILDSTSASPEQLAALILEKAAREDAEQEIYLSPLRLFPTQAISDPGTERPTATENDADARPVEVVESEGFYFITGNHHSVCSEIRKDQTLIPVTLLKADGKGAVYRLSREHYHDWETFNSIKFFGYPV